MKKIIKPKLKKTWAILVFCACLTSLSFAQCHAGFTYTLAANGQANFTNTSSGLGAGTVYHWNFGDGSSSALLSPNHSFTYNGNYVVNLSVWDSSGSCFDSTSQVLSVTNGITCNIAASFSYTAGSAGQYTFTNTSTNMPGGAHISWYFANGNSSALNSPTFVFPYNGSYQVQLNVSDSSGMCSNYVVQTLTVTNSNPCNLQSQFTFTNSAAGQVQFTNTSLGLDSTTLIRWNFGDGAGSNILSPSHAYAYNGTYTVNLQIGDTLTPCYSNFTATLSITNAANATACTANFTDSVKANGMVYFTNLSSSTSGSIQYSWSFGDGQNSMSVNPIHTYTANGNYYVSLTLSDSSGSCHSSFTDSVIINNAGPAPCVASVTFYVHKDSLNPQPGVWEISPNYSAQVNYAIWNWGDGTSSNGLYPTHTYSTSGHYNICVMVYASCGDSTNTCQNDSLYKTSSMIQVTVVNKTAGIKQNMPENETVVYPNPGTGLYQVSISGTSSSIAQIGVLNLLGELVYSSQDSFETNTLSKQVDLRHLSNGSYFLKVVVDGKCYLSKLIKN